MTSHLKVVKLAPEPKPVLDHQVPIFLEGREAFNIDQWDLTTQQVLPYIDGFNHVARIAVEADVENSLVKSCVQNLVQVLHFSVDREFEHLLKQTFDFTVITESLL